MALAKRSDYVSTRRKPWVAAVLSGAVFGMVVALVHLSHIRPARVVDHQSPHTTAEAEAMAALEQKEAEQHRIVTELAQSVDELKSQRDTALQEAEDAKRSVEALKGQLQKVKQQRQASTDRHALWKPSAERDKAHPELATFLKRVAVNNEVLVAVSNANYAWPGGMLELWMKGVKRAGIKNAMVVALDEDTKTNVEKFGLPAFRMDMMIPESQKESGSNHAVSALKFRILTPFIELGYGVLLSDVDVIHLQNPFKHLVRDSDVESMSDGWDSDTAYGYNDVADDPSMGWARYAHSMRIFVFNSGYFYLRPTKASKDLLAKVVYRVETENGWDQALFNECIFFPNSPKNQDPAVTRRAMNIEVFMNSKVLFKFLRHDVERYKSVMPAAVHVNYHPQKFERMQSVWRRYVDNDIKALDEWPDGSE